MRQVRFPVDGQDLAADINQKKKALVNFFPMSSGPSVTAEWLKKGVGIVGELMVEDWWFVRVASGVLLKSDNGDGTDGTFPVFFELGNLPAPLIR